MKRNKIVLNFFILLIMVSCSQETIPDATIVDGTGTRLISQKRKLSDGSEYTKVSYHYNGAGQLTSEVSYISADQSFVASKAEYFYNDQGKIIRSTSMFDVSSNSLKPYYSYGVSTYEYDAQGRMIRQNTFLKKDNTEEPTSYLLYEYNASNLLIKRSQFSLTDELIRYSTYSYDNAGNVISTFEYERINNATALTVAHESTFEYDDKRNPYKEMYKGILVGAHWMSSNNVKKSMSTHYVEPSNPTGDRTTSSTYYKQYNTDGFPVSINEGNGSELIFVYEQRNL